MIPACRYRSYPNGAFACGSSHLRGATESTCIVCPYADKPNPGEETCRDRLLCLLSILRLYTCPWPSCVSFRGWKHRRPRTSGTPTLARRIRNFIGVALAALVRPNRVASFVATATVHAIHGFQKVPLTVVSERAAICQPCGYYQQEKGRCVQCGCGAGPGSLINMWKMPEKECPIGKWGKHEKRSAIP